MIGNGNTNGRWKCGELADLPRMLKQTQNAIRSSRELLERSQKFLRSPPAPSRTEEARQVVQEHIDDQRALAEKLRRRMN